MTTLPHDRGLATTAMLVQQIARDIHTARAHVRDELHLLDGYPGGSDSAKVSGTAELTPTEAAADARLRIRAHLDDIEAGVRLLNITAADVASSIRKIMGMRVPVDSLPTSCVSFGEGHPRCGKVPSEHELTTGHRIQHLCDDCWGEACHTCGKKSEGRLCDGHRSCEACYRRDLRARGKAVA